MSTHGNDMRGERENAAAGFKTNNSQEESLREESREYPSRPFVGVGVVVLKGDSVLLVRRSKPPREGEWSLPGGSQHLGETVRATAAREVREETGVEIEEPQFLEVVDAITHDADGKTRFHYTLVDFYALWRSGEPCADDDAAQAEWVPLSRLESLELWDKTEYVICKAEELRGS